MTTWDPSLLDRAFTLGERARGRVSPNPFVGCVLTDPAGTVVGEGWTQPPGGPHAEAAALAEAGGQARGGTAYVTLEPCNHHGNTPPCSQALVAAGIARVVYALSDPNPPAVGGGAVLAGAGIEVIADAAAERAQQVHEVFLHGIATGRPFVIWKAAMSLDGRTTDADGHSHWITSEATRREVHRLRAAVDAVVIGSQTAVTDDPSLTVRLPGYDGPQPLRVVLDRRGRTAGTTLRLLTDGAARTLVLDDPDPRAVLDRLWGHGVRSLLLEGGAGAAAAFVSAGLVDTFVLHYGGVLLGDGLGPLRTAFALVDAPRLRLVSATLSGDDVIITAKPQEGVND